MTILLAALVWVLMVLFVFLYLFLTDLYDYWRNRR